jgi:hypothetical protein
MSGRRKFGIMFPTFLHAVEQMNKALSTVIAIMVFSWSCPDLHAQDAPTEKQAPKPSAEGAARFLIVCKSRVADPEELQQRGINAVDLIAKAAGSLKTAGSRRADGLKDAVDSPDTPGSIQPGMVIDSLAEKLMTIQQFRKGTAKETVTGRIFRDRLKQLAKTAGPEDTVVIYTHSHGYKNGFEPLQPLGGIVMDLPVLKPEHAGALLWDEYAELILDIPAKNVVVLTMSCFSGGLVDFLDSKPFRNRWEDRQQKESRNLIILTSQNEKLQSKPILKNQQIINPFTDAVVRALTGEADGFALDAEKPVTNQTTRDGKLSVGELIDFVLYTTEHTESESIRHRNNAKPRSTGSYHRTDVLFELSPPTSVSGDD